MATPNKSPAFQFYPDDFLGSSKVAVMNAQEVGVYVLLLCMDWNDGGITYNPRTLARYCRLTESEFVSAWEVVGQCFVERDGRFWNPRLERERVKQVEYRASQVNAANKRWDKHRNAVALPLESSPSPTPFPSPKQPNGGRLKPWNGEPEPYKPAPFCTTCGEGMGKLHSDDLRLVQLHKAGCANA